MAACSACGRDLPGEFPFCPFCGAPAAAPAAAREQRKVVTVLFCDVTGSTALGERLDPEALRALLARYFDRMRAIVLRHGGSVEKFIGDAVMAVFGIPVVHEDDALRALRAAAEMRDALPDLGVRGRIGVTTGEVVTGTEERLATGDPVNVAARLQEAAAPDEILVGAETLGLARHAVEVEAVAPLALKGKSQPLPAYRLVAVRDEADGSRPLEAPMVGRETELRRLRDAYGQAVRDASCQLFTMLGPAGVGKSRLAAEFLASLEDARVVRGRCLPYGEGITYWPVVEVVKQLPDLELDPAIRAVLGDEDLVTSSEEIAWAFRRLLEAAAAERPLVCLLDDVHWGEDTFLDLVDHIADLSRDAPILLLCMARPELLERRSGWAGGKVNATSVLLEPLAAGDAARLIDSLAALDGPLRERIREAAEGNPLFLHEMVALALESEDDDVAVPPTIQALLAARLDQLDAGERGVLERGAVEGRVFHRGAVEALAPEEPKTLSRLTALVRKELVRPDRAQLAGEDAFRFRHLLIRDAAYGGLPKAVRAELHERFAAWLERHGGALVELDEILGYHLEQAHRYRLQLAPADDAAQTLARRAAERLSAAGRRAYARGDAPAATRLLERAAGLLPGDDPKRLRLLPTLGRALTDAGQWDRAAALLSAAVPAARAAGEDCAAAAAAIVLAYVRLHTEAETSHSSVRAEIEAAIRVFEAAGDAAGLARALDLGGMLDLWRGAAALAAEELERAASHALEGGSLADALRSLAMSLIAHQGGPTPVAALAERAEDVRRRGGGGVREVTLLRVHANLEAMRGNVGVARELIAQARTLAEELGLVSVLAAGVMRDAGEIELIAGDAAAAERALREACEMLERGGDWGHFTSVAPLLVDALQPQGRTDEAVAALDLAARYVLVDDLEAQIRQRRGRAMVLAERGELREAERQARAAVELAEKSDYLNDHAAALTALAGVLRLAGRPGEATAAAEEALGLYERKGNVAMAERTRRWLDADLA